MSLKLERIRVKKNLGVKPSELAILRQLSIRGQDSDDGLFINKIFPSQLTVELDTLYSRSTIQRAYEAWEEKGVLIFDRYRARGVKEYTIDLTRLNKYLDVIVNISPKAIPMPFVRNSAASVRNSAASLRHIDPFLDPFYKKGINKNMEVRSPSFTPLEEVRKESLADMDFKPTDKDRDVARSAFEALSKILPGLRRQAEH